MVPIIPGLGAGVLGDVAAQSTTGPVTVEALETILAGATAPTSASWRWGFGSSDAHGSLQCRDRHASRDLSGPGQIVHTEDDVPPSGHVD